MVHCYLGFNGLTCWFTRIVNIVENAYIISVCKTLSKYNIFSDGGCQHWCTRTQPQGVLLPKWVTEISWPLPPDFYIPHSLWTPMAGCTMYMSGDASDAKGHTPAPLPKMAGDMVYVLCIYLDHSATATSHKCIINYYLLHMTFPNAVLPLQNCKTATHFSSFNSQWIPSNFVYYTFIMYTRCLYYK